MKKLNYLASARLSINKSRQRLENIIAGKPVYGLNTGFRYFRRSYHHAGRKTAAEPQFDPQPCRRNGRRLPAEVVRAAMLIRANTLAKGFSGISCDLVQTLLEMLNRAVTPVIYSGDRWDPPVIYACWRRWPWLPAGWMEKNVRIRVGIFQWCKTERQRGDEKSGH